MAQVIPREDREQLQAQFAFAQVTETPCLNDQPPPAQSFLSTNELSGIRILAVDDEVEIVTIVARLCGRKGGEGA